MDREEVIKAVLDAAHISPDQLDLVGKILSLKDDSARVSEVKLYHNAVGRDGLSADVLLHNNFFIIREFIEYLSQNGLPTTAVSVDRDPRSKNEYAHEYRLRSQGVLAKFYKPDFPKTK